MLFWKNINSKEMDAHENIVLIHRASINDYSKNYCMEVYQTIMSSSILYHLEMYLVEENTRQRRHQVNFKREKTSIKILYFRRWSGNELLFNVLLTLPQCFSPLKSEAHGTRH